MKFRNTPARPHFIASEIRNEKYVCVAPTIWRGCEGAGIIGSRWYGDCGGGGVMQQIWLPNRAHGISFNYRNYPAPISAVYISFQFGCTHPLLHHPRIISLHFTRLTPTLRIYSFRPLGFAFFFFHLLVVPISIPHPHFKSYVLGLRTPLILTPPIGYFLASERLFERF